MEKLNNLEISKKLVLISHIVPFGFEADEDYLLSLAEYFKTYQNTSAFNPEYDAYSFDAKLKIEAYESEEVQEDLSTFSKREKKILIEESQAVFVKKSYEMALSLYELYLKKYDEVSDFAMKKGA